MSVDFFPVMCPACNTQQWGNVYGRLRPHSGCTNLSYTPAPTKPKRKRIIPRQPLLDD
jgi:hypothetical protein